MNRCENHIIEDMNSACAYCSIEVLQARLKESEVENAKLRDCLEPGKANAINAGMFEVAERLGLPHSSVKHALTLLEEEIVSLRERLKESEALRVALHDIFELASRQKSNRDCATDEGLIATALAAVRVIRNVADEKRELAVKVDELEASAAAMREALKHFTPGGFYVGFDDVEMVKKALSTLAGKELLARLERYEKALEWYEELASAMARYSAQKKGDPILACLAELTNDAGKRAAEALKSAREEK